MNKLKMPDAKVPDFLFDLYYDLRERHLLPLVAILLVAIVALPIVLSGGSTDPEAAESEVAIAASSPPSSNLVVAKAAPGLRDYRKRLIGTPRDPFIQKDTAPAAGVGGPAGGSTSATLSPSSAGGSPSGGAEGPSVTVESTSPETPPTGAGHDGTPSGGGEPSGAGEPRYYSFAIDVRIVPVSPGNSTSKATVSVRRNLPELTMLPSREEPALTFMEVSKDEKKALMLVSDKVTGLFGDGVCVVGSEHCQLLALETGVPETVVYGPQERTFRVELLNLSLLATDKLHKAPLSKPTGDGKSPEGKSTE